MPAKGPDSQPSLSTSTDTATRQKILDAAKSLFVQRGNVGFSLRDVTRHAGLSVASVNYHFDSRKYLLIALLMRVEEQIYNKRRELFTTAMTEAGSVENKLRALLRSLLVPVIHIGNQPGIGDLYIAIFSRTWVDCPEDVLAALTKQQSHLYWHVAAIKSLLPQVTMEDAFWRLFFVLSIEVSVQLAARPWINMGKTRPQEQADIVIERILDFVTPGLMQKSVKTGAR